MDAVTLLPFILLTALIASASPGPATLTIAATAMEGGRGPGVRLALGVLAGSVTWSVAAAAGLSAVMVSHGWIVETVRYAGAVYLLWLAFKTGRAAWQGGAAKAASPARSRPFLKGLLLHLTNPKAIFFFGALYSVILTPGQSLGALALVVAAVGVQSAVVFVGYALLLSRPGPMAFYRRSARWINAVSSVLFAGFAAKLLTARLG